MIFFTILWTILLITPFCLCQSEIHISDLSNRNNQTKITITGADSVCNFDPIAVGNRWVYTGEFYRKDIQRLFNFICMKEVLRDTQINNKTYKVIKNNGYDTPFKTPEYERIDTVTGIVYLLNNNIEFKADSLHAKPNDIFYNCRQVYYGSDYRSYTNFDSLYNSILFDTLRQTRHYRAWGIDMWEGYDIYDLSYGFGISYWYTWSPYIVNYKMIQLKGCVINGVVYGDTTYYKYTSVRDNIPVKEFGLSQNYPNPFNPSTRIKYSLEKGGNVNLKIFDILGREIETLVNRYEGPGNYEVEFAPRSISDGVYIYRLQAGDKYLIKKMIYLK